MNALSNPWPDQALPLCSTHLQAFEGFRAAPYADEAGIATIGYGTTRYPGGRAVTLQDAAIGQAAALQYLAHDLAACAAALSPHIARRPTAHQAAAMLSLAYNIGADAFIASSLLRGFNAGDPAAADAFLSWDKAHRNGGLVAIPGLLRRRQAERALFLTPD